MSSKWHSTKVLTYRKFGDFICLPLATEMHNPLVGDAMLRLFSILILMLSIPAAYGESHGSGLGQGSGGFGGLDQNSGGFGGFNQQGGGIGGGGGGAATSFSSVNTTKAIQDMEKAGEDARAAEQKDVDGVAQAAANSTKAIQAIATSSQVALPDLTNELKAAATPVPLDPTAMNAALTGIQSDLNNIGTTLAATAHAEAPPAPTQVAATKAPTVLEDLVNANLGTQKLSLGAAMGAQPPAAGNTPANRAKETMKGAYNAPQLREISTEISIH
jgi:hypothetical protein